MVDQELPVSEQQELTNEEVVVVPETQENTETATENNAEVTTIETEVIAEATTLVEEVVTSNEPTTEAVIDEVPNYSSGEPTETSVEGTSSETEQITSESKKSKKREFEQRRAEQLKKYQVIYDELTAVKSNNGTITVNITSRVKGGLRCTYKTMPLFLPASHFGVYPNTPEAELNASVGQDIEVNVLDATIDELGRFAIILTRKKIMREKFWSELTENKVVDGTITTILPFGIVVNFNNVDGLVHYSRLAFSRPNELANVYKVGQKVKASIVSVNKETRKISLSMKEFESSPFNGITEKLPVGSKATGTVKSIINFGAYIELFPNVLGLLRNIDYSWTQRVRNLNEVLTVGDKIDVFIIDVSEEKQQVSLGVKQFSPNPWETIETKYNKEDTYSGVVSRTINQGYIVKLEDQIEAFIPKSKLTPDTAKSINIGDTLSVKILDIVPKNNSIVLCQEGYVAPQYNNDQDRPKRQEQGRDREKGSYSRQKNQSQQDSDSSVSLESTEQSAVTFFDMLDESQMNKISKLSK
ncbi:MAG: 30S ribosomal protein S1 [Candidatus Kapabacteria bacterium]|nr:30S ribosomal protein S1 [Candidatus Kapabacteria bacterium]